MADQSQQNHHEKCTMTQSKKKLIFYVTECSHFLSDLTCLNVCFRLKFVVYSVKLRQVEGKAISKF